MPLMGGKSSLSQDDGQGFIHVDPPMGFPLPQLVFLKVRPQDMEPPPDCPLAPEEFKLNRRDAIYSMDLKVGKPSLPA